MFKKIPPQKYTLEIPCKIRINSKEEKDFQAIIDDLFYELISKDKKFSSREFDNSEIIDIKQLEYLNHKLTDDLYFHLDKILHLKMGYDSKKISYNILNLQLKKGSLVLTFTIVFNFIEFYKNIDDIIDFFLDDFSNYINFLLDQYKVTYKYYLPFGFPAVSPDISHNKNNYIKNILFPIAISVAISATAIIINKENKEDLRNVINEELIKYKNQEKINKLDDYYKFQQYFSIHKTNELLQKTDSIK